MAVTRIDITRTPHGDNLLTAVAQIREARADKFLAMGRTL